MGLLSKIFGIKKNTETQDEKVDNQNKNSEKRARPLMSFDFQLFPHWAMVAFAARCARRAQIAILAIAKHFPEKDLETINFIITQVEDAATMAKIQKIDVGSEIQIIQNFIEILSNKKQASGSMGPFDFAKAAIMCIDNALNLIKSKNAQLTFNDGLN